MTEDLAKAEPPLESEHKNALDTARKIVAYASVFSDLFNPLSGCSKIEQVILKTAQ
jgi:hypothetical protein